MQCGTHREGAHTGLGLSVSYGIINRHRGTITVDSVEGEGTTFAIKLPIAKKTEKQEVKEEKVIPIKSTQKKALTDPVADEGLRQDYSGAPCASVNQTSPFTYRLQQMTAQRTDLMTPKAYDAKRCCQLSSAFCPLISDL